MISPPVGAGSGSLRKDVRNLLDPDEAVVDDCEAS